MPKNPSQKNHIKITIFSLTGQSPRVDDRPLVTTPTAIFASTPPNRCCKHHHEHLLLRRRLGQQLISAQAKPCQIPRDMAWPGRNLASVVSVTALSCGSKQCHGDTQPMADAKRGNHTFSFALTTTTLLNPPGTRGDNLRHRRVPPAASAVIAVSKSTDIARGEIVQSELRSKHCCPGTREIDDEGGEGGEGEEREGGEREGGGHASIGRVSHPQSPIGATIEVLLPRDTAS